MPTNAETVVVVTDANVLINLMRIGQLPLLGQLDGYRFLVPAEVVNEITEPDQREALSWALTEGHLEQVVVDTMESLQLFAELRDVMGMGEAACLALAATRGCHIASDEKKRFRRKRPAAASVLRADAAARSRGGGAEQVSTKETWWTPSTSQWDRPSASPAHAAGTAWPSSGG